VEVYEKSKATNPKGRSEWVSKYDYVACPKQDGYRSIHLIYRYQSDVLEKVPFNGQRIEIQIRSSLQHAWATAVEVAQTFTGQALKSKVKTASKSWLRFFALMGSAIALREQCAPVPNTPKNRCTLARQLRTLERKEKIIQQLVAWGQAVQHLQAHGQHAHTFLLILDAEQKTLNITPYPKGSQLQAQEDYLLQERWLGKDSPKQVVLVTVDSLDALRKAYPNYYADTGAFIAAVREAISSAETSSGRKPSRKRKA
jgi:hypothetical protein